ncbi:SHOCT domain-containing protein [Emergencia sp. JLR.KK010]|uniref:SHOCT domain-containing protein n=1 Tax=Emergencia sp. JLR.KK010 TaxID=3114296 RepID=UPI0030D5B788
MIKEKTGRVLMERMRTAEEMVEYCKRKGTASGRTKWKLREHFSLIEEALGKDEYVMCCFAATYHVQSIHQGGEAHVEALTNKRLLIAREGLMQVGISAIRYDDINEIKIVKDEVLIDTSKKVPNSCVGYNDAKRIQDELNVIWPIIMHQKAARERQKSFGGSIADELTKLSNLRERGLLTEQEFQQQKALLLYPAEEGFLFDEKEQEYEKAARFQPGKVYHVRKRRPIHSKNMDYEEMEERVLRNDYFLDKANKRTLKQMVLDIGGFIVFWILFVAGMVFVVDVIKG